MTMLTECPALAGIGQRETRDQRWFLTGGAGFIGSHFIDHLLNTAGAPAVTVYDNFSTGREWHYEQHRYDPRLKVICGDVKDSGLLRAALAGHDVVIHLACNEDHADGDPDRDFREGTLTTREVLEAMRFAGVPRILFASDSSVYGEAGLVQVHEDYGPLVPCSTFGASKLAGEALLAAYCRRFALTGCAFRFGEVVGPRRCLDLGNTFIQQLRENPHKLRIPGDGSQHKSYLHVDDLVSAMFLGHERSDCRYQVYNVAPGNLITVAEIARLALEMLGLNRDQVQFAFGGGGRIDHLSEPRTEQLLDTQRIGALGWSCTRRVDEALRDSMLAVLADAQAAGR